MAGQSGQTVILTGAARGTGCAITKALSSLWTSPPTFKLPER
jgi:NAD(P)-dependent dehydrogenase (short-subunit alcohol dehydrogenase family)